MVVITFGYARWDRVTYPERVGYMQSGQQYPNYNWHSGSVMPSKMVVVSSGTAQGFQQIFKYISSKFSSVVNNVKVLKNSNVGKFEGLHLLEKHGSVVSPKSNNALIIKKYIDGFKASRPVTVDPEKESQRRSEEIKRSYKKIGIERYRSTKLIWIVWCSKDKTCQWGLLAVARNLSCFLIKRSKGYESDLGQHVAFTRNSSSGW